MRNRPPTIRAEREKLHGELARLPGVQPFPSEANMILVRVPDAKRVFEGMQRARGAGQERVGAASAARQLPAHHVGTPEENPQTLAALRGALEELDVMTAPRTATVQRDTKETQIRVSVNLDGTGVAEARRPASASSTTCSTRSPATA